MRNTILAQVLAQSARARCELNLYIPYDIKHHTASRCADSVLSFSSVLQQEAPFYRTSPSLYCFISVSNLALVKPDKAKAVENYLIQMARMGQLGGKVSKRITKDNRIYELKTKRVLNNDQKERQ